MNEETQEVKNQEEIYVLDPRVFLELEDPFRVGGGLAEYNDLSDEEFIEKVKEHFKPIIQKINNQRPNELRTLSWEDEFDKEKHEIKLIKPSVIWKECFPTFGKNRQDNNCFYAVFYDHLKNSIEKYEEINFDDWIFPDNFMNNTEFFHQHQHLLKKPEANRIIDKPFLMRRASLNSSILLKNLTFVNNVYFDKSTFNGSDVKFFNINFQHVSFENAHFISSVLFSCIHCEKHIDFRGILSRIDSPSFYLNAITAQNLNFAGVNINSKQFGLERLNISDEISFSRAILNNSEIDIKINFKTELRIIRFSATELRNSLVKFSNTSNPVNLGNVFIDFINLQLFDKSKICFEESCIVPSVKLIKATINGQIHFNKASFNPEAIVQLSDLNFGEEGNITFNEIPEYEQPERIFVKNIVSKQRDLPAIQFNNIQLYGSNSGIRLEEIESEKNLIEFNNCDFLEDNTVKISKCNMSCIEVKNGDYRGFRFQNCTWKKNKPLNLLEQWTCQLIPGIFDWCFKVRTDNEDFSQELTKEDARSKKEKYASMKLAAEKSGDKQLATEFHFSQLYWSMKESFDLVKEIYYLASRFGLDYMRAFVWWVIIETVFYFIYSFFLFDLADKTTLARELTYTASTFGFNPLEHLKEVKNIGLRKDWIFFLYFFEKSIQFFLLFQIGAAIRNKVKQ